ncbi:MAG: MMPL family transporter [Alphaproteobacteria bacterium]|nr:MMPL family transporter [Alphaproteobacteria bacterium]
MLARFSEFVLRWRWAIVLLSLVAAFGAAAGGRNLEFSTNYRVFFSEDNPQLQAFESLQRTYVREDVIMFVIQPETGTVFTPELLSGMRDLTEKSWQIPYSTRVDSLTNFQNSYASGQDDLIVEDLVPDASPLDRADLDRIERTALSEPLLLDRIVSPDSRTAAVSVTVNLPLQSEMEVPEAMEYARILAEEFRGNHPDARLAITGSVALNNAFTEASQADMSLLVPLMYASLLLVMAVLLRSVTGTISTLLVIALSAVTAMGLAGWLGIGLTPPSVSAPTIILTIAIADSIHILITMIGRMRAGDSKYDAIRESLRINFQPVFLTSLTTVIGFLSLNFSDAPPFRDLGNITAMGVTAAWIYSILFLPALMAILPIRVKPSPEGARTAMDRFAEWVIAHRTRLLVGTTATVVVLGVMIPRIELNDQFVNYFDESLEFRQDTDFAMDNLSGIYQAQWSLPAGGSGAVSDPGFLKSTDGFADWLRARPEVVHVQTVTDIFKRLNKNMHADDPAEYRLPDERNLAAQYLLLFEMSLPYGLDLNNQINVDKSSTRIVATLENITTNELQALDREAKAYLAANLPTGEATEASGPFVMFAYIAERNIEGMLTGTFLAFLLISATLTLALRSIRLGLISLVPNLIPPVMAFGVWAILVGEIGMASSIVTATSLGIIVDATVHFLSKYRRARIEKGASAEDAVRYAFSTVGTALWVTSAILIAGFGVLSFSAFQINSSLGMLTAITLAMALIADFLLLPAVLLTLDRGRKRSRDASMNATQPTTQAAE